MRFILYTIKGFPKYCVRNEMAGTIFVWLTNGEWCSDKVMRDVQQDLKVNHSISVVGRGGLQSRVGDVFSLQTGALTSLPFKYFRSVPRTNVQVVLEIDLSLISGVLFNDPFADHFLDISFQRNIFYRNYYITKSRVVEN